MEITKEELNYIIDVIKTMITGKSNKTYEKTNKPLNIFSKADNYDQLLSIIDGTLAVIANKETIEDEELIINLIKHLIFLLAIRAQKRRSTDEKK